MITNKNLLLKLEEINKKQKEIILKSNKELNINSDFHSISRLNNLIQNYLFNEILKKEYINLLSINK